MFAEKMRGGCSDFWVQEREGEACHGYAVLIVLLTYWLFILVWGLYKVAARLSDPVGNGATDWCLWKDL